MASPAVIEPIMQKDAMDCVVACLAMLLGKPYREVSDTAREIVKRPGKSGLTVAQAGKVAAKLGSTLYHTASLPDWDDCPTGIVWVQQGRGFHAALVFNGSIYNPASGLLSLPEAFFAEAHAVPRRWLFI